MSGQGDICFLKDSDLPTDRPDCFGVSLLDIVNIYLAFIWLIILQDIFQQILSADLSHPWEHRPSLSTEYFNICNIQFKMRASYYWSGSAKDMIPVVLMSAAEVD